MLPHEFLVSIYNGKCSLTIPNGYNDKIKPSDAKDLIPLIEQYIAENTDESIAFENFEQAAKCKKEYAQFIKDKAAMAHSGYVYLFSCADKYKIGYSKNVEQRIKQLDTRPFPLFMVTKVYSDIAFDIEQHLHKKLEKYRADGEWYDFDININPDDFEGCVKSIENKLKGAMV